MRLVWLWLSLLRSSDAQEFGRGFRPSSAAWILWDYPTEIFDPPWCAVATTLMINDLVNSAQDVVAMTGDCMGELVSPADCAADIASFTANILDAAQSAAAIATACAGTDTGCEQLAIDAPEMLMSVMADLIGASTNCDIDAFLCTINLCGAVKDIWGFATDVDGAISDCPKESFLHHYLKQVYPDWPGWKWVTPRLLESTALALKNSTRVDGATPSGKVGLLDLNDGGPILAADHHGYSKVGSAIAVPKGPLQGRARRLEAEEAIRVPSLHDLDIDVWHFLNYPPELTSADLQRAYE